MSIAEKTVSRPVLTVVVFFIVLILGGISFYRLPIDLIPEITYPTITIMSDYGNVSPQEIEELITRPIEQAVSAVSGVEMVTSSSGEGESRVRVSFAWGADLDEATNDIRDRLDRVAGRLPDDMEKPRIRKFDASAAPVMMLGVSSDLNPLELRKIFDDQIKYRLERIEGVASADIWGGLNREIHVEPEAAKLKSYGISLSQISSALQNYNQNVPAGDFREGNSNVVIRTLGEYGSLEDIENTVVTVRNSSPVRVKDIASVTDSWEDTDQIVRINGLPGLRMAISKQSGYNTVQVADAANAEIKRINEDFPQIRLATIFDNSKYIRQSINNISNSAVWGGIFVVLVLLLFLRNINSTLIIATAIPISVVATFGLMYFGGFTLNIMTFGGLALGIGMLLDSSIVVLENIYKHRESGSSLKVSAIEGTNEVWSALLASVLTTIVVFFPVIFIRGISGIIFTQMAFVVSFSLVCSFIVSLTLIPMLSSKFLHIASENGNGEKTFKKKVFNKSEKVFITIEEKYKSVLAWALKNRKKTVISSGILLAASIVLVNFIGVELMPSADEGEIRVSFEMNPGARIELVDEVSYKVEEIIKKHVPEAVSTMTRVESDGGDVRVNLLPRGQRKRSSEQVANDVRKFLRNIPGATIRTRAGQGMFMMRMNQSSADNLSIEIRGYDLKAAQELASKVEKTISEVEGITDTQISRTEGSVEQIIRIDRQKSADLGLDVYSIGKALQSALGGTTPTYYRDSGRQYRVLLRLKEQDRSDLDKILDLTVLNSRNEQIVLRNVLSTFKQEGPTEIERKDQERIITVSGNFTGRDLGSIIHDSREKLAEITVPRDFAVIFGGDYEEQQKAFKELMFGFIMALVLIYLVMAGQFESFLDPFIILFSVPMALFGIVVVMLLTGTTFTMQAFIGCIMLAGIVVNNAIIIVDYTNLLRRTKGLDMYSAVTTAGARRLRPILMTTATTVLGLLPLSFGLGEGGETQAPLARVVIGGLISSTMITLILIPVLYSLFEQKIKTKRFSDKAHTIN